MRLGDLDEALRMIKDSRTDNPFTCRENSVAWIVAHDSAISCVKACPTIDAVPVVRCRECKHSRPLNRTEPLELTFMDGCVWCEEHADGMFENDFCSYGERKDGDGDA